VKLRATLLVLAIGLVFSVGFAPAVSARVALATPARAASSTQDAGESSPTLEAARKRWERLSPDEKQHAREAYERYRSMSEEERREIVERARRLNETKDRVQRELTPEARTKLDGLAPARKREVLHDLVEREAREIGLRIRQQLPDVWRERLEKATPEERARFFEQFRRQQRVRLARYAIEQIGRSLQLPPEEVRRMQELPDDERAQALLELRKRLSEKEAREFGLPPGLTREEWEEWERLPAEDFFERVQRYRHMRVLQLEGQSGAAGVPHGSAAVQDWSGPPGMRPPWVERTPPERREGLRRLLEAVAERREEVLELSDLPPPERAAKIRERKRQRCFAAIVESGLLPQDEIGELSRRNDHEFFEAVRRILRPAPRPERPATER
jgi:hypothetical protein